MTPSDGRREEPPEIYTQLRRLYAGLHPSQGLSVFVTHIRANVQLFLFIFVLLWKIFQFEMPRQVF